MVCGCTSKFIALNAPAGNNNDGLSGTLHGGQQPIAGAVIQIYAAGTIGDGSPATPLLSSPQKTSSTGAFTLGNYTCPSPTSQVYMTATGGSPGSLSGETNPQITEMAALGSCGDFNSSTVVGLNEITTIAAVYALAPFMKSSSAVGSGPNDAQTLANAFATAAELANTSNGTTPGLNVAVNEVVPSAKISTLANILSTCTNSSGGSAGDSSPCGLLFSLTPSNSGQTATDTAEALLNLANDPTENVDAIFDLNPAIGTFQPELPTAPPDWKIEITPVPAVPTFSPDPGSYSAPTTVTLADSDASAAIYYTTDGSQPTSSSIPYTGAIALSGMTTIRAVAIAGGISSLLAAGTYAVAAPTIALTPSIVTLTSSQTQAFTATVAGTSNTTVTWSLSPAVGSISAAGLYTAPASIAGPQTVTVSATSVADSSVAASATVALASPVSVALTPGSVTLTPSQTQAFTATVSNSSNTAVTWSLSPAVGTISAAGLYTAPSSIASAQTVTVTATSVANSTKTASATLSLTPPVSVALSPGSVTLTPSQTQAFTATVSNSSNTAVTWSLSLAVGSISAGGLYSAPASIPTAQTVTVTATSVADSTKSASASVSLAPPVSVALTPGSVTLTPSQTQMFTASVAGTSNTAVTWSLSLAVGSISAAGVYTAPASIASAQTVTVTATSVADSTKSASSSVSLVVPTLSINATSVAFSNVVVNTAATQSVTLTSTGTAPVTINAAALTGAGFTVSGVTFPVTLNPGQAATLSVQFDPTVTGAATDQLTITSNSSTGAMAVISLTGTGTAAPVVAVAVTPTTASITSGATQQFTASVTGTSNTAVNWTVSGAGCSGAACGTISSTGLYTAPATVPSSATVIITATSQSESTKSASANVTIVPPQAAGYSLEWEDTFSSLNPCTINISGCNWYDPGVYGYPVDGLITDPSGTYVNLNWTSSQGSNLTTMTTAATNAAYFRAWNLPVYIEISMAFDPDIGNWPALWMVPINTAGIGGPSNGGEIDLFEWDSNTPTTAYSTVHVWVNGVDTANNESTHAWSLPGGTNLANYNTYGFLWTSTGMKWYFNNQLVNSFATNSSPFNTVFAGQESFFLILNEQEGCGGSHSCANQVSPLNMKVQWVHVYASPAAPG
jgi:hypothetical protein